MAAKKEGRRFNRRQTEELTLACYRTLPPAANQPRRNIGEAILDISVTGCRLRMSQCLEPGSPITIELREFPSGELFHARGRVRWIRPSGLKGRDAWLAGVQFDEIMTPYTKRQRFFFGKAAQRATPAPSPAPASRPSASPSGRPPRAARFRIDDYVVTAFRQGLLSRVGIRRNIARSVGDLSRTGAQIVCAERLRPGARIVFSLHLRKFADTFETEAEVIWAREEWDESGPAYCTGIRFGSMGAAKQKLLDYMTSWFTSFQARYRQEQKSQAARP